MLKNLEVVLDFLSDGNNRANLALGISIFALLIASYRGFQQYLTRQDALDNSIRSIIDRLENNLTDCRDELYNMIMFHGDRSVEAFVAFGTVAEKFAGTISNDIGPDWPESVSSAWAKYRRRYHDESWCKTNSNWWYDRVQRWHDDDRHDLLKAVRDTYTSKRIKKLLLKKR